MKASQYGAAGYVQNDTNNPYAPPVYSPFQNAAHVDDAFGYMANLYGPGIVQGLFGEDAFLAHQAPGQARLDQYTAARYQRHGAAAVQAANMAGNEQVAKKLLGFQRVVNGGQELTRLDREHANVGAAVLNNPIFKQFAAAQIGAENLEGIMFGRRGDPTALASAASRVGFFRPDAATGGRRMSSESLQQFSQNMYQNLYGPDANLDEMHGFGAVASGEMMDVLFQQGRLPQSIGALKPADRVKAIGRGKRDDKTMTSLAQQFGHSELMERDYDYANASDEERKIMLADKLPEFKKRLGDTFSEIDKYKAGDKRAKSAEEIEQMEGFGLAANALDAKNVSKAVKEYNGAVSAIREIFGDNGNPNAPIQELIANLQHLTNGAQSSMGAGKVESLVREMRMAARDSNTDLKNLNALMYEKKAQARQLGLSEVTAEKGMTSDLMRGQAMADAGVFEKPGFGKLNRAEAESRSAALSTRADASAVGRGMAVLNRMVSENPDKYKGTQLEAAMQAYRTGSDTYEYKGKSYNLSEQAGRGGMKAIYNMAREGGADDRLFRAYQNDQIGTEEYLNAGYAYKAQRFELQRNLSRAHEGVIQDRMGSAEFKKLKPAGMSDADFRSKNTALAGGLSYAMTGIMIDETADMSSEERVATLEKRGREELVKYFKSSAGGNMKQGAAEKAANQYFEAIYGDTAEKRRDNLLATYSETSAIAQQRTGVSIEALKQQYDKDALSEADTKMVVNQRRAKRFAASAKGKESTTMQRVGEELEKLADDNAGTRSDALKAIFNVTSEDDLLQSYAPDMQEGLVAAAKMYTQATITPSQIEKLAEAAQKNPAGAEATQLKKLAGVDAKEPLDPAKIDEIKNRAIMKSADTAKGTTDAEKKQSEQQRKQAELIMKGFNTGNKEDVNAAARAMAEQMFGPGASKEQIEKFATAALSSDSKSFEDQMKRGLFGGGLSDEKQAQARAIAQSLRVAQDIGGLAGAGLEQTPEDVAKAQKRPTAKANAVVGDVGKAVYDKMEQGYDRAEYEKLRPKGMSDAQFETQRKKRMRMISVAAAEVAVNQMGGTAGETAEKRAEIMGKKITAQLAQQFVLQGMDPEEAQAQARKELVAVMGSDPEKVTERLNNILTGANNAKRERGMGVAEATDKVTTEQQKLLDEVGSDPSGAGMKAAMMDKTKRQLLLTLPNADAVSLFKKFTPEAQREGMAALESAQNGLYSWRLDESERANVGRIKDAINESNAAQQGVSSQNLTPEQVQQLNRRGHGPATGGPVSAGGVGQATTHVTSKADALKEVDAEMAALQKRGKTYWSAGGRGRTETKFDNPEDQKQWEELQSRRQSISAPRTGDQITTYDPFGAKGKLPGLDISMREVRGEATWTMFGGTQDASERVFIPHNPNYTEEQAALDVERYGTAQEKADFKKNGAKRVNVTNPDGSVSQVVQKPHIKLLAEQAMLNAGSEDPLQAATQRLHDLEGKKKRGWNGQEYFADEKDQVRYNFLKDQVAQQERRAAGMGGAGGGDMNINGTLVLQGLSEAVLAASGRRMEDTPDGGPPVDMANATGSRQGR
jgi:hypothetical protein